MIKISIETVGKWTADRCLEGCDVILLGELGRGCADVTELWGAFKEGKLVSRKTNKRD